MLRLKPTTIIVLDPHAAAFCDAVRSRLERDYGQRGSLVQTYALVPDGETIRFESDLSTVADQSFDLGATQTTGGRLKAQEAEALFTRHTASLEFKLLELLRAGRSFTEIEEAERDQIKIVDERVIYLLLSSSDTFAGGIILELIRLIRWLLIKQFAGQLFTMDVVVLLPDLLVNRAATNYATTYALLKRLDDAAANFEIAPRQKADPFDNCWLIDGQNANGVVLGSLAKELPSYADAFAGFLTTEPERSSARPGTYPRGKVPAYNSFGYGELFFPYDTAIKRLSSALARDIIGHSFLGEEKTPQDNARKLLLSAKEFVSSKDYERELQGLDKDEKGTAIWQPFKPKTEIRGLATQEYVVELQRRHEEFKRESLFERRKVLNARSSQVRDGLVALLDKEIDLRADASTGGLNEGVEFLSTLTETHIALKQDLIGESPQNLLTEYHNIEAGLDSHLGVVVDRQASQTLLQQARNLHGQLQELRADLRLLSPASVAEGRPSQESPEKANLRQPPLAQTELGNDADSTTEEVLEVEEVNHFPTPEEDRRRLIEEIDKGAEKLQSVREEYRHTIEREDQLADAMRREARQRVLQEKAAMVAQAEEELVAVGERLRVAQRTLDDLLQERHQFLTNYLFLYPGATIIAALCIWGLVWLINSEWAGYFLELFWDNFSNFMFGFLLIAAIYLAKVSWTYYKRIHLRLKEATHQVEMLKSGLSAAAVQLTRAHDRQLQMEYDLLAQTIRLETVLHLIDVARERIGELKQTLVDLAQSKAAFTQAFESAVPSASIMRRPLLKAADIDNYYEKGVPNVGAQAEKFRSTHVSRAQVRHIAPEEFNARLNQFARERFNRLEQLSIEDALLGKHDLMPSDTALLRLRELNDTAEPLLRLRETESSEGRFAQRDTTLWASLEQRDELLKLYKKISPDISIRPSGNGRTLRVLTRCLNFPAYFLGPIEHYRICYEREPERTAVELSDLLPLDPEVKRAHQQLLVAFAFGIVVRLPEGGYFLNGEGESLGLHRKQIAEKLATEFAAQKLYAKLIVQVEQCLSDQARVYERLAGFIDTETDLDNSERELLNALITQKYHPLR